MIIYNKVWLDNLFLRQDLQEKMNDGLVSREEVIAINKAYPVGFNTYGIFARIGFGILTLTAAIFSVAFFYAVFLEAFRLESLYTSTLVLGVGCYIILENFVKRQNYYRGGVDDMLLYVAAGFIISFINWLLSGTYGSSFHNAIQSILIFALCLYLTLRFSDMLISLVTCAALLSFVFFIWQSIGAFGVATLPFIMMAAAGAIYFIMLKLAKHPDARYYANCIDVVKITALVVLYAAGNYFIVQKLGSQLNHLPNDAKIPFGFIFWIWTVIVPIVYVWLGLKNKNLILIRLGMLIFGAAIFTVRYYYHILSTEVALILGGAILLIATYFIIRYLKGSKHGLTYLDTGKTQLIDKLNIESLIVSQTMGHTKVPAQKKDLFGGGSFGGGGSSSNY